VKRGGRGCVGGVSSRAREFLGRGFWRRRVCWAVFCEHRVQLTGISQSIELGSLEGAVEVKVCDRLASADLHLHHAT